MKKIATLVVLVILGCSMQLHAQAPKMMNYQGVARDADGQTLVSKQINLRLSIISANDVNDAVYKEEQLVSTNEFGLFAIKIGEGSPLSGSMDAIDWGSADHYISVEMDVDNNGHFAFIGTSQLLSVPYAFYAETAGKATNLENIDQMRAIDFTGTSGQTIRHNGSEWEASSTIYSDGTNVGIGTTSPTEKLDIDGSINLSTGGEITFDGDRALAMDANRNIMQGRQTGEALTTGVNNNMMGYRAGWKTTTGNNNSIIGYNAGYSNTTGSWNTMIGYKAGYSNTTGANNFYSGPTAGYGSTTGINNVAIGTGAGFSVSSANNNTFIGRNSGYNTTANENMFVGYEAGYNNISGSRNTYLGTGADGDTSLTNATAIGYNAYVAASNSVVLGDGANVGIGTNSPAAKLHVEGSTRLVDGTQADGYVLTSDSEGNATWEAPSFSSVATNVMTLQDGCTYNNAILDASNTASNGFYSASGIWQSFTATQTGYLDVIEVRFNSSFTGFTLQVYDGEGTSDTLGEISSSNSYSSGWQSFDVSSLEIPITAGEQYTFGFSNTHAIRRSSANPYAGGMSIEGIDYDLAFEVYTRVCEDEVISLSADSTGVIVNGVDTLNFADGTYLTSSIIGSLADSDNDTKIQLEESADEDIIRFDLGGTEFFKMDSGRFEFINTGLSVFVGQNAGSKDDLSSNQNTFVGHNAGQNNTTGSNCAAFGLAAMAGQTSGTYNNAFGSFSLYKGTADGNYNNAFGGGALQENTTGDQNAAFGDITMLYNTTGSQNSAFGTEALEYGTTGSGNTAIGFQAGRDIDGSNNVLVGYQAGKSASGSNKLYISNSNDSSPLIYGEFDNDWLKINGNLSASGGLTDDDNDTKIQVEESSDEDYIRFDVAGTEAMVINDTGNVGIGTSSPSNQLEVYSTVGGVTQGITIANPRPVFQLQDTDANTWLIEMNAKDLQFSEDGVGTAMTIQEATGYVGIGTTDPNTELDIETSDAWTIVRVYNDSGDGTARLYVGGNGGGHINLIANASDSDVYGIPTGLTGIATQYKDMVFSTGSSGNNSTEKMRLTTGGNLGIGTTNPFYKLQVGDSGDGSQARGNAWLTFSDRRWKKDFEVIPDALSKLEQVNGYYYYWREGPDRTQQVGVIAQEIEEILPQCVSTDENGYKSVDYSKLSAWLIQVNKEQQSEINLLKTQLLEEKVSNQARLERLEAELGIGMTSEK